ncbi:hypothetical protein C8Q75DRAFT_730201 [Abortiporus biennis]|nr:hypothetical protein C8Q75DRAFT_730201 [Abortiporus biennis]
MIVFKVLYRRLVMPFLLLAGVVGLVISLRELMYPRYPLQYRVDFNHAVTVKRRDSHLGNSMLLRKRPHPFSILPVVGQIVEDVITVKERRERIKEILTKLRGEL